MESCKIQIPIFGAGAQPGSRQPVSLWQLYNPIRSSGFSSGFPKFAHLDFPKSRLNWPEILPGCWSGGDWKMNKRVFHLPSSLKDDGRRKIYTNMGFKIVAKGFNCPCMQSCRSFFEALGMWTMCTMWIFAHCCHLRTTQKGEDVHLCVGDWCIFALLHHHLVLWKRFVAQDWTCINLSALPRRYFTIPILNTMTHAPFLHTSSLTFACAQLFHGSTFYSRWWSCVKASFQLTEYEWCSRAVHNAY